MYCKRCANKPGIAVRAFLPGKELHLGKANTMARLEELVQILQAIGSTGAEVGCTPIKRNEFYPNGIYDHRNGWEELLKMGLAYFKQAKELTPKRTKYPAPSLCNSHLTDEDHRCGRVIIEEEKQIWGWTQHGKTSMVRRCRKELMLTLPAARRLVRENLR